MLEALYPGRIDLGIGRAPGSDYRTTRALQAGPGAARHRAVPEPGRRISSPSSPTSCRRAIPSPASTPSRAAPARPTRGSSARATAAPRIAAYFGCAFSFAHFITDEGGPRGDGGLSRAFPPVALARKHPRAASASSCSAPRPRRRRSGSRCRATCRASGSNKAASARCRRSRRREAHPYTPQEEARIAITAAARWSDRRSR